MELLSLSESFFGISYFVLALVALLKIIIRGYQITDL